MASAMPGWAHSSSVVRRGATVLSRTSSSAFLLGVALLFGRPSRRNDPAEADRDRRSAARRISRSIPWDSSSPPCSDGSRTGTAASASSQMSQTSMRRRAMPVAGAPPPHAPSRPPDPETAVSPRRSLPQSTGGRAEPSRLPRARALGVVAAVPLPSVVML